MPAGILFLDFISACLIQVLLVVYVPRAIFPVTDVTHNTTGRTIAVDSFFTG